MDVIELDGFSLDWNQVKTCLYALPKIRLSALAVKQLTRSREVVEKKLKEDRSYYGINTGFGKLANTRIPPDQQIALQENFIYSHAVGVGEPLSEKISRLIVMLRTNCLAQGYSGVRLELVQFLCELINKGVTPVIPSQGSVGASGDLAPLAHIGKVVLGEGEVWYQGDRQSTKEVFSKVGLKPLTLAPKEGLSIVNGTQASLAIALDVLLQAQRLIKMADITAAISLEGDLGSFQPFDERLIQLKPHPGAIKTASNLRKMVQDSEINLSHKDCQRVQDPYSLRCVPQVHGAAKDAYHFVKRILEVELNATTDNPLVFEKTEDILNGGNFHGEHLSLAMDVLAIALAELGSIAERRVALLVDPIQNEIPTKFLIPNAGIHSGFMIPHVVMSALVSENKTLSHPAVVDSIPTSAGQEDHVSMSCWAARKAKQVANNVEKILGVELLAACQALDLSSGGKKAGRGVRAVHQYIRERLPILKEDKPLAAQLEISYKLMETDVLITVAEKTIGSLDL